MAGFVLVGILVAMLTRTGLDGKDFCESSSLNTRRIILGVEQHRSLSSLAKSLLF